MRFFLHKYAPLVDVRSVLEQIVAQGWVFVDDGLMEWGKACGNCDGCTFDC